MEDLIEKAKRCVEKHYGAGRYKRPWLDAEPPHSYGNALYRVRLFVLAGSPPKGFVLANYGTGTVKAFDSRMKHLFTFTTLKQGGYYI